MTTGPGAGDLATALGLVLVLEGIGWALAPGAMKRLFEAAKTIDEGVFRIGGLLAVTAGVALVWWVRG